MHISSSSTVSTRYQLADHHSEHLGARLVLPSCIVQPFNLGRVTVVVYRRVQVIQLGPSVPSVQVCSCVLLPFERLPGCGTDDTTLRWL